MFGEKYVLLLIFCVQFNPAQSQTRGAVIPTTRPPTSCQLYQATCNNGDCIDRSQVCNGVIDCADGSDESGCRASNECEPNEYQCENKKCVLKTWRCDGDDDCGDGTDEQNCQETDPSNPCRFYEWQCSSGDQCIPKSFHCDGEMDCQDQSDEIGCTGPVIVISPPPAVLVDQSYTFIINCTAMGIPTPEVVWRLNWGHVPEKCRMTNQVQEGNRAYGELTCTNAQKEDSGAYSCEAINSMGSCFAGSAGCGQPGQDAIVVVNAGNSVCPSGYFNNLAVTREDCLPCYCSELSDTCSSADLYFSKLPPPAGIFQLISRDPVTLSTVLIRRLTPEIKSVSSQRLYLLNKSMLEDKGVPYFSMPNSHTGNLLKSYGGYLKFSLSYAGEGNLINEPMIIIQGENNMLVYYPEPEPRPGVENRIEVRFWPGDWFTDYKNGNRASREDILRVLSNVKYLLLKAQQVDSGPIDTTISDISMDSADTRDSGAGSAVYIEQCVCPPGYTGLSCESCSPGYERSSSGTCRRPSETCPTGYYADPDTGECNVCPCPLTTPSNQFGRECRVDTDRQVTCVCATGYTGRRCGDCSPGYVGNPALPGGSCTPGPVCNYPDGSFDRSPNPTTGRCRCKAGYTGEDCNQAELSGCGDYKFLSREESVPGCINCFCMGVPTRSNRTTCQPSQLYRYKERAVFQEDHLGFSLTDRNLEYNINSSDLILSTERQEISYDRFDEDPETIYYWKLPHQFLGNKLTSYGGYLEFILRHIPTPGSEPTVGSPLIEIQGNDVILIHDSAPILETNSGHKFKVRIHEKDWKRFDGGDTNREHLLMALANLDHILIRASHSPATREGGIADVSLECAVNRTTGGGRATAVEGCICPRGYKGLSCEDCAPGYTRSGSGVYLGTCEPCNCNGKSSTCDPENGICLACRDFTVGPSCESCIDGFFKDPRSGGCIPESGSISPCSCDPRGSLDLNCINNQYCQCKENVEGMNCDRCKPGTFNLDYGTPQGCRKCFCSGVTDECSDARLFWSTLRMNAYDKTYLIKDESQQIVKDRELRFDNRTMEISYQISPEESGTVYYWELPRDVTGNRLGSYGGNLTIIQRYLSSGRNVLRDPAVIIVGGEVTLVYPESKLEREDGIEKKYKIPILESEWMVGMSRGRETPASREDMLSALSDVKAILVRASVAEQTVETYIRKTMLDIAVPQMTGGPLVQGAEECRCPVGYSGYSCESCALGYYRDWTDRSMGGQGRCVLCPCNNNEDSCSMVSTQEVECICKAGYSGQMCEYRGSTRPDVSGPGEEVPITITMNEPKIQIIEVGNTVRFSCNAIPRFRSQDPMTIAWAKENGLLPAGRASDNGQGLLVITSVRSEDSGTYICTATTGRFVKTETAVLSVEGGESTMAPIASIDPPYQQISVGDRLQMDCRTSGSPTPTVTWSRGRGEPLNPRVIVRGSSLFIGAVGREDEGEYICTASSTGGSTQSRTQIYVTSSGNQENKPQDSSRISVNPQDLAISVGDSAMFICEVSGGENYRISWERMEGRLPFTATESSGRLTISAVRVEDSGIYICQATSSSGAKLESQARLTITSYRGPPSVRIEPEEQTIGQGSSTELRCIGSGEPAPSLEWSKVGEDLSSPNLVVSGGVLSLRNAAVSDRGMYICTAENAGGSARASGIIEVERREPPGVEIYPENSQTITKSGSVLFQCRTIAGIPSPLVTWTRVDGLPLQPNVELLGGGVLRINRVTGKEQGGYKCRAQNEVGSTEAIATLVVQEVPTIILQPKGSVTMQVGTKLSISCSARGDPPPSVSWKKIGMTTRQVGTSSPVFEISRLTKEDEGTYACVARNIAGETEERVQIIVLEEDEFYSYPDQSGGQYPGQNGGRYPDQSGGRYPDQNGERYPDQNEGRYPDQNEGRYPDQSGGRYPDQNEGRYPDQSGGRYPDQNEGRYPDQSGEPGGLPLLDNQPVSVGANIRLECMTVGEGASFSGQWKRADGRRFPTRHYQSQGILNLVRVDADDEGVYVCEVVDNRGSVVYEVRKEIILISPPRITLDPQRQTVNPGDSPLITCSATGSEPINILWSREDGSNLPRSVSQSRGRLQFRGISVRDQGRYSCTASNPDGNSVATAEVIVNENSLEDPSDPGYKGYQPPRNPEKGYQPPSAPQPYKGYQPPRPNPMEDRSRGGASGAGLNQPYPDLDQGNTYPQPSYPDSLFYDTEEVDYYDYGRRPEPINPGYSAFPDSPDYERRSEPERLTASIGANIDLPCRLPENNLVTWRRDGGALPPTAQQITNTLRISKVLDQDSGRYICSSEQGGTYVVELRVEPGLECDRMEFECSNKAGCVPKSQLCDGEFDCTDGSDELSCGLYRIRRGIQSMRRNPVVTVEPSSPRIVEGGSLDISCKVAGVESGSVRFSWSKVGSPELPENTAARGNLIRFMNLVGENNGLYRCTAETELGIFYSDYSLFVQSKGQEGSEPGDESIREVSVDLGRVAELKCSLETPVTWSKVQGIISRDSSMKERELKIFQAEEKDAGEYSCKGEKDREEIIRLVVTGIVPYFAQAPISYLQFPTLPDAYLEFKIQVSFRAESDGLIFYNGQDNLGIGDFIALGLEDGFPVFRFNMGSGVSTIKSVKPVQKGEWHTAVVWRSRKNASLSLDGSTPVFGFAEGIFQGLDLLGPFYVGGLPTFNGIGSGVGFKRGFVGCVSKVAIGPRIRDITKTKESSVGITGCETCAGNPCDNGGKCQESNSESGFICICSQGFSGKNCSKVGDACSPGVCGEGRCEDTATGIQCYCPLETSGSRCEQSLQIKKPAFTGDSYIAFTRPKHILRRLNIGMKFKTKDLKDSVLFYCSQSEDGKGDFASLAIKDGYLEFRFDTGSGAAILRSNVKIELNIWHEVKIRRKLRDGSMVLDNGAPVVGKSPGNTRGLNIKTPLYVGGLNLNKYIFASGVGVQRGFTGCIVDLEAGGQQLDLKYDVLDSGNIGDCNSMSPCEVEPCKHDGVCVDQGNSSFSCSCAPGYYGELCEEEENLCNLLTPCLNNGKCIGNTTFYSCFCSWGFAGVHCNRSVEIGKEIGFKGNGYLELDRTLFPHSSRNTPETFSITFTTEYTDGILFWQSQDGLVGNGGDFLALVVEDGYPSLQYELGGGPANMTLETRVNDGNLHKLEITREGRKGELVLNDKISVSGSSKGLLQMLNTAGNIFIGGGPDPSQLTGARWEDGFRGCIHALSLQGKDVNFKENLVTSANIVPCKEKSLEVAEDYNDVFYSSLMEDLEENFDEDAYLERLNRIG